MPPKAFDVLPSRLVSLRAVVIVSREPWSAATATQKVSLCDDLASDNGHYVTLARRVFPGVRTLAYGQTATVRGEASDALC
jgi:hypothetical protein